MQAGLHPHFLCAISFPYFPVDITPTVSYASKRQFAFL